MKVIDPASGETLAEIQEDDKDSISLKYRESRSAMRYWTTMRVPDRIGIMWRFHDLIEKNENLLAKILTSEVGKPIRQSHNELRGGRNRIRYFLSNCEKWLAEELIHQGDDMTERITYEPLGVIANISAWNYPWLVGINVFVPALIGGNAVLYKPSEFATLTGQKICELLSEAGIPKGVMQCIAGGAAAGQALLNLPLDGYFFTGSYRTGQKIFEQAAKKIVPVQMELGGKDPLYVTDDNSDLAKVAAAAAEGAFYNAGQSCCAVERIYVHQSVYQKFLDLFVEEVRKFKIGNPLEENTFIGPLTRTEQIRVLELQVADAKEKGGRILLGGKPLDGPGNFFNPTIIADASHSMLLMKEESFGPLIGIMKVEHDEEAVTLMQDTEYGLTAAVYSDEFSRAEKIMNQMNVGTVYWNCCDRVSPNVPWSGRKHSGIGSTLSQIGIRAFVRPKAWQMRGDVRD